VPNLTDLPAPAETSVSIITNPKVSFVTAFLPSSLATEVTGNARLAPASKGAEHPRALVAAWGRGRRREELYSCEWA
jgi:hypothetical protein